MLCEVPIYIQFAENGNIRKWAYTPFDGGRRYEAAAEPRRADQPVDWGRVVGGFPPGVTEC